MSLDRMPRRTLLCATPLAAAALLISACGGSSSIRAATTPSKESAASPKESAANRYVPSGPVRRVSNVHRASARTYHDPVTHGVVKHRPFPGTGGGEVNDDNPGNADAAHSSGSTDVRAAPAQLNPCALVSSAQARAILGRPVGTPVEAPLGPTCIYRAVGAKSFITVAVEPNDLANVSGRLRDRRQLKVGGRAAYCGIYGQPTVFVALADGRVLAVTASCTVGVKFAADAMSRLKA